VDLQKKTKKKKMKKDIKRLYVDPNLLISVAEVFSEAVPACLKKIII